MNLFKLVAFKNIENAIIFFIEHVFGQKHLLMIKKIANIFALGV
jgi:hypothetical protein